MLVKVVRVLVKLRFDPYVGIDWYWLAMDFAELPLDQADLKLISSRLSRMSLCMKWHFQALETWPIDLIRKNLCMKTQEIIGPMESLISDLWPDPILICAATKFK